MFYHILMGIILLALYIYSNLQVSVPEKTEIQKMDALPEKRVEAQINNQSDSQVESIIVTYRDNQYDLTNFIKKHPGGKEIIQEYNNQDITEIMAYHQHGKAAYRMLEKYKIN